MRASRRSAGPRDPINARGATPEFWNAERGGFVGDPNCFHKLIVWGDDAAVKHVLRHKRFGLYATAPETQFGTAETALHVAARRGHAEIVQRLLDRGAWAGARDRRGRTPLEAAREARDTGDTSGGWELYEESLCAGDYDEVVALLTTGDIMPDLYRDAGGTYRTESPRRKVPPCARAGSRAGPAIPWVY